MNRQQEELLRQAIEPFGATFEATDGKRNNWQGARPKSSNCFIMRLGGVRKAKAKLKPNGVGTLFGLTGYATLATCAKRQRKG